MAARLNMLVLRPGGCRQLWSLSETVIATSVLRVMGRRTKCQIILLCPLGRSSEGLLVTFLCRGGRCSIDKRVNLNRCRSGIHIQCSFYHTTRATWSDTDQNHTAGEEEGGNAQRRVDEGSLLEASLPYVRQYGWTTDAISEGARSLGLSGALHGIFSGGGFDLIDYFEKKCNRDLAQYMKELTALKSENNEEINNASTSGQKVSSSDVLRKGLEHRLRMTIPYMERWPQALAIKSNPIHVLSSLNNLGYLMDDMWYYAGDRSTDSNWYTKRVLLAGVYTSTEVFMSQDHSEDFAETWKFMERRLDDVKDIGINMKQFIENVNSMAAFAGVSLKTVINILGWKRY